MKKSIILIGGGGHCKSCIDVIEQEGKYDIKGIIDLPEKKGQKILSYEVIGNDNDIPKYTQEENNFLITLGHLGDASLREKLFNLVKEPGGIFPVIISPLAYVSKNSIIDEGTIVMHHAIINADAQIGKNCIINSKALIEHDAIIEDNTHISTGAIINGVCKVGENCFIGSRAILNHSLRIIQNTIIGAGAVVAKDIIESGVYVGNPAKKIR